MASHLSHDAAAWIRGSMSPLITSCPSPLRTTFLFMSCTSMLKQDLTAFSNAFAFSVTVILIKASSGGTILTALVLSYTCDQQRQQ
ncbi:hypothetical protein M752DRAFT_272943 [Aspergillus phoenicis ATCC 13157]|uniref:Uncharacterized protein n=1 Tax=Aspergillus phoenicis ATCC 13157 TaxID=1353007 RepID=A0A370PZ48_ASPPH|nr:hypothetical protein M752DRAFT_272943 [Aspergillus phoenicis ATCC 13157]